MNREFLKKLHADIRASNIPEEFRLVPWNKEKEGEARCVQLNFHNRNKTLGGKIMLIDSKIRVVGSLFKSWNISTDGQDGIHCVAVIGRPNGSIPVFLESDIKDVSGLPAFLQMCLEKIDSFG